MKAHLDHTKAKDDRRERLLLERIVDRDREAFDELFKAYHPRLFRFVFRMTASYQTSDEIVNDILLTVWQSAHAFRGASKVSTWIFGIAYRQSLSRLRKRKNKTVPISDDIADAENLQQRVEQEDWLQRGILLLPPKQLLTVMLVYYLGLTCEETAAATGSPVNSVKTRMFHARRKLRVYLSKSAGHRLPEDGCE